MCTHIILIPKSGDPHGLIKRGPCGSMPPTARLQKVPQTTHEECFDCDEGDHGRYHGGEWHTHCTSCGEVWPCPEAGDLISEASEHWVAGPCVRPDGLVLAWDGKVLDDGVGWLANRCSHDDTWIWKIVAAHLGILTSEENGVVDVLKGAASELPGTLILTNKAN